jgi:uncharacterized protein YlxW (UPF0749 family)
MGPGEGGRGRGIRGWQVATAVALLVLGFLFVVQFRAGRTFSVYPEIPTRNIYALATLLRQEREARKALEKEVTDLRRQLHEFEQAVSQGKTLEEEMSKELETLRAYAGLLPMRGPGVVVRVEDAKQQARGISPVVVQYQDIVAIVNELWAAGAEAVAINDQRVTASTGLGQVGGTIVVNLKRVRGPYEIRAIGDPETLAGAMNIRGGLVESLRALGLVITVEQAQNVEVPAYKGTIKFTYAKVIR